MTFICAHCGAIAYPDDAMDITIDNGATLTCNQCLGATVVTLRTPADYVAAHVKEKEEPPCASPS